MNIKEKRYALEHRKEFWFVIDTQTNEELLQVALEAMDFGVGVHLVNHMNLAHERSGADELRAALEWALPLAELALEDTRLKRLDAGHDDIGREAKHPGLWPDEVAKKTEAQAALKHKGTGA